MNIYQTIYKHVYNVGDTIKRVGWLGLLLLATLWLAACAGMPGATPATESSAGCAQPAEGNRLLSNAEMGYCLIYMDGFVVEGSARNQLISPAPGREANVPPVPALPWMSIDVTSAGGNSSAQAADALAAQYEGFELTRETITLGGAEAVMFDGMPGQEIERRVLVVHNDQLYALTFVPADPSVEMFAQMERLYATVTGSFNFLNGAAPVDPATSDPTAEPVVEMPENLDNVVIRMERGPCFGACPMYTVTVNGDGSVEYEGRNFVVVEGVQQAQLSEEQLRALVAAVYEADFWNMQDRYEANISDLPSTITTVTIGTQTKSVYNQFEPPAALVELEETIDEISGAAAWVHGEGAEDLE